jgi:site-specific recombinase XerD
MDENNVPTLPTETALEGLEAEAAAHLVNSLSRNTRRAYRADWEDFQIWCGRRHFNPLPATPRAVALYITEIAHALKVSSIERRLVTIKQAHLLRNLPTPTDDPAVRKIWRTIRKEKSVAPTRKSPTLTSHIRKMVARLPTDLMGLRDRALLLIGFAGAMRRSELTRLNVSDLEFGEEGVAILICKSKTDQLGNGRKIGIPFGSHAATCPVRAVKEWLVASALTDGPLFRGLTNSGYLRENGLSDRMVARIVKRCVENAGYDAKLFAGHSLRAGLATAAALAGVSERSIQNQTGHKSLVTLRRYIRDGSLFKDNAAGKVGL